ncbi:MAG: peptide deformylase [bacterium]
MSKILSILTHPNNKLRKKSIDVLPEKINSPEIRGFFQDLKLTMNKKDGVGLAAPQTGENIRVIIIKNEDKDKILINPVIIKKSFVKLWGEEGCLSVPNTFGEVRRHKKIKCAFLNEKGKKESIQAEKILARIIQHEIDHLDGILFIDTAKNIKKL